MIYDNVIDMIGNTPMVNIKFMDGCNIYAKAEFLNPGGSIKDRIAKYMIEEAEKRGELVKGMTIMEPTSGNTGIGIVMVGRQKGYKVIIVMPKNMSEERVKLIKALGAEIILTRAEESLDGAINVINEYVKKDKNIFVPQQFKNMDNVATHYETTAKEIWEQTNGKIDVFISGIGSGGTITGIGKFLKEKDTNIKVIAVEPKGASALLGHKLKLHKIQGIGDGFIPEIVDVSLIDDVIEVSDDDAINTTKKLITEKGLLVGISSGANVWAGVQVANKYGKDLNIVTVLPDRAERYFSVGVL
ncbi:MAG: cysteine synthase A [Clostridiales bacterium GWE2_32_10]|nr:MAG: cysteine synthase A [Clostridiales bacterium GWE2_32_10]